MTTRRTFLAQSLALTTAPALFGQADKPTWKVCVIGHTGRGNYGHGLDVVWNLLNETTIVAVADANAVGRADSLSDSDPAANEVGIADPVCLGIAACPTDGDTDRRDTDGFTLGDTVDHAQPFAGADSYSARAAHPRSHAPAHSRVGARSSRRGDRNNGRVDRRGVRCPCQSRCGNAGVARTRCSGACIVRFPT